jgi:D-tyrosyl-tRNA(Tyr) deacylase
MKAVIQRVSKASLSIDEHIHCSIGKGIVVLIAISKTDTQSNIDWIIDKILKLRIFSDENEKMNLSIKDIKGEIMLVSNFTLYADTRKGTRPSYVDSATPEIARPIFDLFVKKFLSLTDLNVVSGVFGANMNIELINNGPVTIILEK